ncbi:beta-glucosidase 11-like isoform X2 [Syzygium oleosum]|uniref:beta-glucosidase 11-like isoform X2 n=1 Tax=Syzygium oleosum TaxID=219896 RepID=UPI0024B96F52|nr:beta-glucosidase 11-like isoform X2 [Syzygium oleosum]
MMMKKLGFLLQLLVASLVKAEIVSGADEFTRYDFPPGFVFGAATSAYQVEGAANEDGRTPSIMDTWAHSDSVITGGANGDIACDQYHKYKEDVQLMAEMGLDAYRFSISWSRLIPRIEPHVTIHHFDLPQALEDEYGGWISRKIVKDFMEYADICFRMFGDRVKYWTTFNEANIFTMAGYDLGFLPPNRCSSPFGYFNCTRGDSSLEPYLAAHNIILSHASAARLYQKKYQSIQKGYMGLNLLSFYFVPCTNRTEDVIATQRANDFFLGWFVEPLVRGDYPEVMKKNAGSRLPSFTALESQRVKGSYDFFAVNFYSASYVKDNPESLNIEPRDYKADMAMDWKSMQENASSKYTPLPSSEIPLTPWGLQGVLELFKQNYGNPPIFIHENGQRMQRNASLEDWPRIQYLQEHISVLLDTVRNGSNAKGYFTWSFLDVFELLDGFRTGYGLYYVDLDDPELRRYPKLSAEWYSRFLKGGSIAPDGIELEGNWSSLSSAKVMK